MKRHAGIADIGARVEIEAALLEKQGQYHGVASTNIVIYKSN